MWGERGWRGVSLCHLLLRGPPNPSFLIVDAIQSLSKSFLRCEVSARAGASKKPLSAGQTGSVRSLHGSASGPAEAAPSPVCGARGWKSPLPSGSSLPGLGGRGQDWEPRRAPGPAAMEECLQMNCNYHLVYKCFSLYHRSDVLGSQHTWKK